MGEEVIFLLQSIGVIGVGSFIGEFQRNAKMNFTTPINEFTANLLAIAFLSIIGAYLVYYYSQNRGLSLIFGALLSYQDEGFLSRLSRNTISFLARKFGNEGDE